MKILLVGEYSRLHNSLKEGLEVLGHSATIVGTGDDFKKFNVDYSIYPKTIAGSRLLTRLKNGFYKITGQDLEKLEKALRFYSLLPKLKHYDHVQLINSDALETFPWLQQWLYKKLFRQNRRASLLICGDDTPIIEFNLQQGLRYSVLSPYIADKSLKNHYLYSLKYVSKPYKKLFDWLIKKTTVLITSDLDYKLPMDKSGYNSYFIPNPININKISFNRLPVTDKIVIFLGINRHSYLKKGLGYFEEALRVIAQRYHDKVEIIITENVPYNEYITLYERAHILLDQVYGYDQGYNALEAMAAGKVVFTGAEDEFMQHYNLTERVAVNALPDTNSIVAELIYLIENPSEIEAIAASARVFVEKEHDYKQIAEKYLEVWRIFD